MEISETALISQLEYLKKVSEETKGRSINLINQPKSTAWIYSSLCEEVDIIIKEYNWIIPHLNHFLKERGFSFELIELKSINPNFEEMNEKNTYPAIDRKLIYISLNCNKILSIIKNLFTPTKENKKNFEELKKEIEDIGEELPKNILNNIDEAIKELELDKKLGAVLICGRIIIFNLNSIPGNLNEKIEEMRKIGILGARGSEEWIIKAEKKARDLFAHDLNYSPEPSDAISILGDMIKIVKIVKEYHKLKEILPGI